MIHLFDAKKMKWFIKYACWNAYNDRMQIQKARGACDDVSKVLWSDQEVGKGSGTEAFDGDWGKTGWQDVADEEVLSGCVSWQCLY